MYTALIIDTLSIQSYIFGSNKLKENIGGSYIIEHLVYKKMIPLALEASGISSDFDINKWTTHFDNYLLKTDSTAKVEAGYIGGGNALVIFRKEEEANTFINFHSKLVLQYFPGLKIAYATHEFNYEEGDSYKFFLKEINRKLYLNRSYYPSSSLPFKHGIAEDCAWSNEAQEIEVQYKNSKNIVSQMSKSRIDVVEASQKNLEGFLSAEQVQKYAFTTDLGQLGQQEDKGYVAIVHADGNGMGIRFRQCDSLAATRKLSKGVIDLAETVMRNMIQHILALVESKNFNNLILSEDGGKKVLPIRPLISGGDDITFVCEGRLGIHLAEKLLKLMTTTSIDGETISACAGIAIVHTKYPFYKAYQMAEELTHKAKEASRQDKSSWIHYLISTGGFSGSYEDVLFSQYTLPGGKTLKNGPYRIDASGNSIQKLKSGMQYLITSSGSNKGWPGNKIKDLRDTLRKDEAFQKYFLAEIDARGLKLPSGYEALWTERNTPFHDMVELLDFYPQELLSYEI